MQASLELQRALVGALARDAAIIAQQLRIYDGPPVNARAPYLSVGVDNVTGRNWQGGSGYEHRFSVMLWDVQEGFSPVKETLAAVEKAVLTMPRGLGLFRITSLQLMRSSVKRTQRNWTLGTLEFRALSVMEN